MKIFWQLIRADLVAFKQVAWSETLDLLIWACVVLTINVYLLPLFGVPTTYILISFSGTLASAISFRTFPMIYNLVGDIYGDRQISQKLILPIHPAAIFGAMIISTCLTSLWVSMWAVPAALIIIHHLMPELMINIGYFTCVWLVSALFFSVFSIWVASFVKGPQQMGKVFIRFMFPLWFFGGFQFTWEKLYGQAPMLAYIDLLNPYIYAMEAMRTAVLGPEGNLDFGLCILALLVMAIFAFTHAFRRFKKQLDFV
jgi:ABC-type polysaccharide/polyol phosphate export permease